MSNKVALDTDFMNIFLTSDKVMTRQEQQHAVEFFKSIFRNLNLDPVIHEYIFKQELIDNELARNLVKEGFIKVIKCDDFLKDSNSKNNYIIQVKDFYKTMKGNEKELKDFNYDNFLSFHEKESNLGEILSILMARRLNIPCFFSNDKGAKSLVKSKINNKNFQLEVLNVMEVLEKVSAISDIKLDMKMIKVIKRKITRK